MIVIGGALRDYAWGRPDGLAAWTPATDEPQAELWFGAHPTAPSPLIEPTGEALDLEASLRAEHRELPLLVKLLAAATPLSIQVHPPRALAQAWWADPARRPLLADDHEKSEMLLALDEFSTLVGFRAPALVATLLAGVGLPGPSDAAAAGDLTGAVAMLLGLTPAERRAALAAVPAVAAAHLLPADASAMNEVLSDYPDDPGALVALCLRHFRLAPGDAVFVPAGLVHAYVRGLGVEVMTSSDNVLRLGLTPKPVAVEEALEATDATMTAVVLRADGARVHEYETPGSPFRVTRVHGLPGSAASTPVGGDDHVVVLAVHGTTTVDTAAGPVRLRPGLAGVLAPEEGPARVSTEGLAIVAQCPAT